MQFDIRTLLVAVALANVLCDVARIVLWRQHPKLPGLGHWALAGGASALVFFLILFHGLHPWPPFLSLAQLAAVFGLLLAWDGFRRFIGYRPLSRRILVIVAILVTAWIVIASNHELQFRSLGNAVIIAILSALIARELLMAPRPTTLAMRATGWVYAVSAVIFLMRIITADQSPVNPNSLNPDGHAAYIILWWMCMAISVTLGMVLMTTERLQADLDNQANHDPLTGALNRRALSLITDKEMARFRRHGKPLSVMVMDLDNFKQINDRLGHNTGDVLLCRFVSVAKQILRGEDTFYRFGGEEFVALIPDATAEQALVAAERLRQAFANDTIEQLHTNDNTAVNTTVSIGIAELDRGENIDDVLQRADTALYRAKSNGRNRCEIANLEKPYQAAIPSLQPSAEAESN